MDTLVADIPPSTTNTWTTATSDSGGDDPGASPFEQMAKVMLRQLSEKLDMVRQVSGGCLVRLLQVPPGPPHAAIPHRDILTQVFQEDKTTQGAVGEGDVVNWLYPNHVFPLLASVLPCRAYFHDVFSGLVISIGGLSESVVKESSSVLLQFCREHCSKDSLGKEGGKEGGEKSGDGSSDYTPLLLDSMSSLFSVHAKDDRVIVPLLKTLNLVLKHGFLESLQPHVSPFFPSILTVLTTGKCSLFLLSLHSHYDGCDDDDDDDDYTNRSTSPASFYSYTPHANHYPIHTAIGLQRWSPPTW